MLEAVHGVNIARSLEYGRDASQIHYPVSTRKCRYALVYTLSVLASPPCYLQDSFRVSVAHCVEFTHLASSSPIEYKTIIQNRLIGLINRHEKSPLALEYDNP